MNGMRAKVMRWSVAAVLSAAGIPEGTAQPAVSAAGEQRAVSSVLELFGPSVRWDESLMKLRSAEAVRTERGTLRVRLKPGNDWPEVMLAAPGGKWDLSRFGYLHMRVNNTSGAVLPLGWRIDNHGANGSKNCLQVQENIVSGQSYEYVVAIPQGRVGSGLTVKMFGMRGYPAEVGGSMGGGRMLDPKEVLCVRMFGHQLAEIKEFEIERIWADGKADEPMSQRIVKIDPEKFFPCIDTYGQYIHRDWPGKIHSAEELAGRRAEEEKDLAANPGPSDWNRWGGWEGGPQLKTTGFFRTEKVAGKWWLVDPDGRLFISHGIDCISSGNATPIDEREHWFENFPGDDPKFKNLWWKQGHVVNGHYKGKQPRVFDFSTANVMRKYGENWKAAFSDMTHRRLRSWCVNTIANWSSQDIYLQRRTPYFACLHTRGRRLEGSTGYWGKFPDPFDKGFTESIGKILKSHARSINDPWCIGFFVDNELSWGNEQDLGAAVLRSRPDQPAKIALLPELRAKYGTIEKLNAVWETSYADWDALMVSETAPKAPAAVPDIQALTKRISEQYFKVIRDALKTGAPNQLYAGCRFAWANRIAAELAAEYCDIVSYNVYARSVASFKGRAARDVPMIIGEFHFGALDRGMFHTGLVSVPTQDARAKAYYSYVEGVVRNPNLVGCHWFKYMDEPCTGRGLDGENYQIGFVDIVDTPYPETVEACRKIGRAMYRMRYEGGK